MESVFELIVVYLWVMKPPTTPPKPVRIGTIFSRIVSTIRLFCHFNYFKSETFCGVSRIRSVKPLNEISLLIFEEVNFNII